MQLKNYVGCYSFFTLHLYEQHFGVDSILILKWPVPLQEIIFVVVFYILILISASGTEPGTLRLLK